jgi:alkylation response protein AidB-like acyl-CoA dehydrogenase
VRRDLFTAEHEAYRDLVRTFFAKEVVPFHAEWERDGIVPRDVWLKAGAAGMLGTDVPIEYGGGGIKDFRYNAIGIEEMMRAGATGIGFSLHNDINAPYLLELGTEEQKQRWLPGFCSGELVTAIGMTEPGAGSDLQGIRTTAVRDGDSYVVNGAKTFITNGINADLVIVVVRTDPDPAAGFRGMSLIVVERGMKGFERGRNLDKMGLKAQDTAELFFDNVRVPAENLLGAEGSGFLSLKRNLPQERLAIAVGAAASNEWALEVTAEYARTRYAFGKPIADQQNTRFTLAEVATETQVARVFVDRCIELHNAGALTDAEAAMAKYWVTETNKRIVDQCLQLHGGYGYMSEYPISKAYTDTRIQTIYGGTTEIMKEIIGRELLSK